MSVRRDRSRKRDLINGSAAEGRMAANPFLVWLAEVAADAVVVRPEDIEAEACGNQSSFSLSPEQPAIVSVADVEEFATGVADGRRAWLSARPAGPMVL